MTYFKTSRKRLASGITLLEVIATLLLVGMLAVGVVSFMPSSNPNLATETDQLASQIRYTQLRAQGDIYQWRLTFKTNNTYQIGPVVLPGSGFQPKVIPGNSSTLNTLANGVTSVAGSTIQFDSWGRPTSLDGVPYTSDRTVTLTEGAETQTITIRAQTGLVP